VSDIKNIIAALKYAKEQENLWRANRILRERDLIEELDTDTRLEGSKSYNINCTKVTITRKLSLALNFEAYQAMHFLPENQFVKMQPKIDLQKLREVEREFPKEVAECIITKPAKTAVTLKEII
jgi:hypothetical protein